jgi:hypothetical protein
MDDHGAEYERARRATIATNRCERSFARSHDRPRVSTSRASWQCSGQADRR